MALRLSKATVTFGAPFTLKGLAGSQPAGTYDVETEEEIIEGNHHTVYRRVATLIYIRTVGMTRTVTVDPDELAAALAADRALAEGTADDRPSR